MDQSEVDQTFHGLGNAIQKLKSASAIAQRQPEKAQCCFEVVEEAASEIEDAVKALRDVLATQR